MVFACTSGATVSLTYFVIVRLVTDVFTSLLLCSSVGYRRGGSERELLDLLAAVGP